MGREFQSFDDKTKKSIGMNVFAEPLELWRNLDGHNLFDAMYNNPSKYLFPFQTYAQLTLSEIHMKMNKKIFDGKDFKNNINVMERSLYSSKYVFVDAFVKE
jgi:hypothetical protein